MQLIESFCYHALLEHLEAQAPDLVTTCRWLACGPTMAPLVLGEDARPPSGEDIARLESEVANAPAAAAAGGQALFAARARQRAAAAAALEHLVAASEDDWSHPTEILGRRCPDFGEILEACRAHLETPGAARRLQRVAEKLERAVRVETAALRRRAKRMSR